MPNPFFPPLRGTIPMFPQNLPQGPQAAPMPMVSKPKQSLWQMLQEKLMPVSSDQQNMLSVDDTANARHNGILSAGLSLLDSGGPVVGAPAPSLGQAVARAIGAGRDSFQQGINGAVQSKLALQQAGMQQDKANMEKEKFGMEKAGFDQQQKMQTQRDAIQQKYASQLNGTEEQRDAALKGMFNEYVRIGDTEMVGRLAQVIPSLSRSGQSDLEWQDFGGEKVLVKKSTGEIVRREKKSPSPRDPNAPDTAQQMRDQRIFQREQILSSQFQSATKQHEDVSNFINVMEASGPAALKGDPTAQQSLIYGIMKLNDPGSSVKEGEYATAENARGVPEAVRNSYNKLLKGSFLPTESVQRYLDQGQRLKGAWRTRFNATKSSFERRAKAWGVDPNNVIIDYFGPAEPGSALPPPPGTAGDPSKLTKFRGTALPKPTTNSFTGK